MKKHTLNTIPPHTEGMQSNTESSATLGTTEDAKHFFEVAKQRLLQVNKWHELAGTLTADFQLTNRNGKDVDRPAQEGDYFKIDIPGPGSVTGDGYDWVQIERIEEVNEPEVQSISMRVRPAPNPNNSSKEVAHFFSPEATSSFIVNREDKLIKAGVYGRNEKPNTHAEAAVDKLRNAAVATSAVSGFSKLQWKSLVNGFVKKGDE